MNKSHYRKKYFSWQKKYGEFGGKANLIKFNEFIKPHSKVIDFGCGGGYLLANINCREKLGIEINKDARNEAKKNGIKVYSNHKSIPNNWADIIISNHVIEHVDCPLEELKKIKTKVRKGGLVVFVVPCERYTREYQPADISQHLYTWSPLNLGNLFTKAGYKVIEVKEFAHSWPSNYLWIEHFFGMKVFNLMARIKGLLFKDITQIRVVAQNNN